MGHYFIGDVQGCYDPLQRLLDEVEFDPAADRLIFCGDVVSRGGQSLEVLRLLHSIRPQVTVTLGNHDFHLLHEDSCLPDGNSKNREFRRVLQAGDRRELIDWLAGEKLAHYARELNALAVHAGVVPQWTLEDTLKYAGEVEAVLASPKRAKFLKKLFRDRRRMWRDELAGMKRRALITHILTRIRFCDARGKLHYGATGPPGTQPAGYLPWYRHRHRRTRDVVMVFGHWASLGLKTKKRYVALDSGCVWGGSLTAWQAEDKRVFQVPCKAKKALKKGS